MQVENIILNLAKASKLTVDYIENEIKKHGDPLRWAIVKIHAEQLVVHAVVIK
jgi:hypothetical protein